ncbi:hypothetical protein KWH75_10900 [Morganella morganii]|uniref:hypothetical protein n=1 Tax=Morganella morganii TaxID=582 RepID=UPI0021D17A22|nr:hypothetical protein [Morganella morganii]MCU6237573.1 hypothetical protein [Morganella morganii]
MMTLLKKITILKIAVLAVICIIMANESHDMKERFPYLFGLVSLFISSLYVFACFKIVDDKNISVEYCVLANMVAIFVLFPLIYSIFFGFFPVMTCLSFSISFADVVFFQLTIYKFAYHKASGSPLVKWIMANMTNKKN